jgi:hypothetical protein
MSLAQNFTKQLEDLVGVPNAFGSQDLESAEEHESTPSAGDEMEELMDDDSDEELENISDNYPNGEII